MESGAKPDLIIGVDFGMTCTGVAYANISYGSDLVRFIQKWPGRSQANENKVPSILVYPHGHQQPSSWGFLSEQPDEQLVGDKTCIEWFKTLLDPNNLAAERQKRQSEGRQSEKLPSLRDVERYYEDYLRLLYEHLKYKLAGELSNRSWDDAQIEFIFSLPTTWKNNTTVENFRSIIKRAGYGTSAMHTVTVGLTEAEAAAVHVSKEAPGIFREGDVLLVCDAGGGTTDLSVLRVTGIQSEIVSLEQLDVVFGRSIGSAAIDVDFEKLVKERLLQANRINPLSGLDEDDLDFQAWFIRKSAAYQDMKCEYGSPASKDLLNFVVPALQLPMDYVCSEAGIERQKMRFACAEFRPLFDKQINQLFRLSDIQLERMKQKLPSDKVTHLILSGGLGNSAYVQQQFRARYEAGGSNTHSNAQNMQVRVAPDPQLAVCKGIVRDRVQKLKAGKAVLGWRCCRASYGTICRELYDKKNPKHIGREISIDPYSGKHYVANCVDWFVRTGKPVSVDQPIVHQFVRKVAPGDPRREFPTKIVVSHMEPDRLPDKMTQDVQMLCTLQADLSGVDEKKFVEKNKKFWSKGKHHYRIDFEVKVLIGPADLRFELWFDGKKLSKDQSIKVEWIPASGPGEHSTRSSDEDAICPIKSRSR